ncbi:MAG: UDP-N-acetylmuramoyl-tripeptide--D-alanyl-D-alanine ligase [Verrucomicrobia bacterium]|nr:UDP-N-acetylmuramoyl-tripeptide--D-alanyl-D-alanine ligase [Verrucomicrobiota bacterium]
MPIFTSTFLAHATGGHWTREPECALTGFGIDTRSLRAGEVFVAIKTAARDGHAFLATALAAGAGAALVAQPDPAAALPQLVVPDPLRAFQAIAAAHRQAFSGPVVGISGSAGKTSTKELLALLLSAAPGDVLATAGNLNNHLGVPLTLTRLDPAQHRFAVVEAGIGGPGEMSPLAHMIAADIGLITLIGPAHLEALGSLDGVAREKALLLSGARPGALKLFPRACLDYAAFRGLTGPTLALVPQIAHSAEATRITFAPAGENHEETFTCRRVSDGMASNAALALAAALSLGITADQARARIAGWRPADMRGELRRDAQGRWLYVDCYNANPASMHDGLAVFAASAPQELPRLYVIGGMEELGAESPAYHRVLGRALGVILRPEDSAVVLASEPAAAAVVEGAAHPAVRSVAELTAMREVFEAFAGAVFIKGSRRYRLESLLQPADAPAHAH